MTQPFDVPRIYSLSQQPFEQASHLELWSITIATLTVETLTVETPTVEAIEQRAPMLGGNRSRAAERECRQESVGGPSLGFVRAAERTLEPMTEVAYRQLAVQQ
ncbi:MAG: hypothetical protein MI919_15745 [Holophagales bacterium]|nr:hypothetical protein [Holophagales bacterium]